MEKHYLHSRRASILTTAILTLSLALPAGAATTIASDSITLGTTGSSGSIQSTATASGSATGDLTLGSGNATSAASGAITLQTGTTTTSGATGNLTIRIGNGTASAGAAGTIAISVSQAGTANAGGVITITGGQGGAATTNAVGQNGGTISITGGAGTLLNGSGSQDGSGGDVILLGGARAGAAANGAVNGIVRVGNPTVGSTKTTNLLAVEGGFEVDGAARFDGAVTVNNTIINVPQGGSSSPVSLAGNATLTPTSSIVRVIGSGGAVTLSAATSIANGTEGQILIIEGTDDTNTVAIADNSNVQTAAGVTRTLGLGDTLTLIFIGSGSNDWFELAFSNN